ncbi:MAG: hypothetical protein KME26_05335 [Oscillatoria princeps RMCB-10]|jgi:hypothetical protein|nr:hypothetical protein [Oscillatoria princeps RMCB-10]
MGSESDFTWEEACEVANAAVKRKTGEYLSDIEVMVLEEAWNGLTYDDIAKRKGYSVNYLTKDVGNKLWKKLSDALGEKVTKKNFKEALKRSSCRDATPNPPQNQTAIANTHQDSGDVVIKIVVSESGIPKVIRRLSQDSSNL